MVLKRPFELVRENKTLIFISLFVLFMTAVIGYLYPSWLEGLKQEAVDSMLEGVEDASAVEVMISIIANNLRSAALSILFGILFLPILTLTFNGYLIGSIMHEPIQEHGFLVALVLLPHGIFEIPAICISIAFGLRIGLSWFGNDRIRNFGRRYIEAFQVFIFIVVPLLIVAGIIEGALYWILT